MSIIFDSNVCFCTTFFCFFGKIKSEIITILAPRSTKKFLKKAVTQLVKKNTRPTCSVQVKFPGILGVKCATGEPDVKYTKKQCIVDM